MTKHAFLLARTDNERGLVIGSVINTETGNVILVNNISGHAVKPSSLASIPIPIIKGLQKNNILGKFGLLQDLKTGNVFPRESEPKKTDGNSFTIKTGSLKKIVYYLDWLKAIHRIFLEKGPYGKTIIEHHVYFTIDKTGLTINGMDEDHVLSLHAFLAADDPTVFTSWGVHQPEEVIIKNGEQFVKAISKINKTLNKVTQFSFPGKTGVITAQATSASIPFDLLKESEGVARVKGLLEGYDAEMMIKTHSKKTGVIAAIRYKAINDLYKTINTEEKAIWKNRENVPHRYEQPRIILQHDDSGLDIILADNDVKKHHLVDHRNIDEFGNMVEHEKKARAVMNTSMFDLIFNVPFTVDDVIITIGPNLAVEMDAKETGSRIAFALAGLVEDKEGMNT